MSMNIWKSNFFIEALLGLLSAFGPFVMDMYLSSFPLLAIYFDTTPGMVQLSLAVCTVGLAIGQLFFGCVSDSFGRKSPLLLSLGLYIIVSLGCIFSPSIWLFIVLRFFQGVAAAGGVVISRSIAADCYSGRELAGMFGKIAMINEISTVVAPMFGGVLTEAIGWKAIFWLLIVIGVVLLSGVAGFRESLPQKDRAPINSNALINGIRRVMHNQTYVQAILQYSFCLILLFVNLASAPFILDYYGVNPGKISIVFGINAIALAISARVASRFQKIHITLKRAALGQWVFAVIIAISLLFNLGFWIYETTTFLMYMFIGAMYTSSTAIAMDSEHRNAGIASAFLGAFGYVSGGTFSILVSLGNLFITTPIVFVVIASMGYILAKAKN